MTTQNQSNLFYSSCTADTPIVREINVALIGTNPYNCRNVIFAKTKRIPYASCSPSDHLGKHLPVRLLCLVGKRSPKKILR